MSYVSADRVREKVALDGQLKELLKRIENAESLQRMFPPGPQKAAVIQLQAALRAEAAVVHMMLHGKEPGGMLS